MNPYAPNLRYRSGDFTVAMPIGGVRTESTLLPELNDVLVFHQDYVQRTDFFIALPYNFANFNFGFGDPGFLFEESPREDYGGGCIKWTRSWVRVPNSYGKAGGIYPYIFPGFGNRNPFRYPVAMEITRDFFLCGTGGVYSSWQDIPIQKGFQVLLDPADPSSIVNPSDDASSNYFLDDTTSPTDTAYAAMIAAGQTIQVEDDKVTNFRGGVYMRERYTVLAR